MRRNSNVLFQLLLCLCFVVELFRPCNHILTGRSQFHLYAWTMLGSMAFPVAMTTDLDDTKTFISDTEKEHPPVDPADTDESISVDNAEVQPNGVVNGDSVNEEGFTLVKESILVEVPQTKGTPSPDHVMSCDLNEENEEMSQLHPSATTLQMAQETKEDDDVPTFEEFKQQKLNEQQDRSTDAVSVSINREKSNNYASLDCGSKVVSQNTEAQNPTAILMENKDYYMLNPCSANIWFVVELCDFVAVHTIEIATFELFSSMPKDFVVYSSERFPGNDWSSIGEFRASDCRTVQIFPLTEIVYAKYIKVEMLSHFGEDYYCPISLVRVLGATIMEEFQEAESRQTTAPKGDESVTTLSPEEQGDLVEEVSVNESLNDTTFLGAAKDAVLNFIDSFMNHPVQSTETEPEVTLDDETTVTIENHSLSDNCSTKDCGASDMKEAHSLENQKTIEMNQIVIQKPHTMTADVSTHELSLKEDDYSSPEGQAVMDHHSPTEAVTETTASVTLGRLDLHPTEAEVAIATEEDQSTSSDSVVDVVMETDSEVVRGSDVESKNTLAASLPYEEPSTTTPIATPIATPNSLNTSFNEDSVLNAPKIALNSTIKYQDEMESDTSNGSQNGQSVNATSPNGNGNEKRQVNEGNGGQDIQMALNASSNVSNESQFPSVKNQEKSVLIRLSNRVRDLEDNMTLFSSYLDQLSTSMKKNKNKTEEIHRKLNLLEEQLEGLQIESVHHTRVLWQIHREIKHMVEVMQLGKSSHMLPEIGFTIFMNVCVSSVVTLLIFTIFHKCKSPI